MFELTRSRKPRSNQQTEIVKGCLVNIRLKKEESGWMIAELEQPDGTEVTITGVLAGANLGDSLELHGNWDDSPRYGLQFKVRRWSRDLNAKPTRQAMEIYLGGGTFPYIGPKVAAKIVGKFGDETYDIFDNEPHRLLEIKGITQERLEEIMPKWRENRTTLQTMAYLQSECGLSAAMARRVMRTFFGQSLEKVKADPYCLTEVDGIGFLTADQIAQNMGIEWNDMRRVKAGILYALADAQTQGSCCYPVEPLKSIAWKLLGELNDISEAMLAQAVEMLQNERRIVVEFDLVYESSMRFIEFDTAARIKRHLAIPSTSKWAISSSKSLAEALLEFEERPLTETQRTAVVRALQSKFSIVTGGPGVGKTTTLRVLVDFLNAKWQRFELAAPTGRAAKRMTESTGAQASTIHRLLGLGQEKGSSVTTIFADFIIIDESSMLDLWLFWMLLKAVPENAHVILVGDSDQLPSVGAGYVLGDLIASDVVPVTKLDKIFRQGETSSIIGNAHRINQGQELELANSRDGDFFFMEQEDDEALAKLIVNLVSSRIPNGETPFPAKAVQVLSPMKRGPCGVWALNKALQEAVNPPSPLKSQVIKGDKTFRVGDPVLVLVNDYERKVYNGDVGVLVEIQFPEEGKPLNLVVQFDPEEEPVTWSIDEAQEAIMLGYATTVHKSQGSEYQVVVMAVSMSHYKLLERQILYTGVTRAKQRCILVGSRRAIKMAVDTNRGKQRYTRLANRLKDN